ncbi:MAG: hypothetical protein UT63_C0104G0012 [Candidatus Gottesmanbacteria bacterium GW2011_GWC2_39_8]|uniref:Uncharacterized protein n=1 Tax=Candidatus Gottesmanbacteria bacterium GW2011_GWC2_39_8 TaxID=1618450 RepID=A0A0G0PYQ8_9BACT|nr:MAG: hypothetical protein UT63_C0104G0012 [Candidatus Gottesmanbacteria bacterium GW2011_GWC2_39_8]
MTFCLARSIIRTVLRFFILVARSKPSLIYLLVLIILTTVFCGWFWFEISLSIKASFLNPEIYLLKNLLLPIVPLVIGLSFLTILSIMQDVPAWARWVTALTISLPIFFVSSPPNAIAALGALVMLIGSLWTMERIRVETEDHLRIKIIHLSMAGGIPQLFLAVIIAISLLAVASIAPTIKTKGIQIPPEWVAKSTPFILKISGIDTKANEPIVSNQKVDEYIKTLPTDQQNVARQELLNSKNQQKQLDEVSTNLGVLVEAGDTMTDVLQKFLQQKIESIFKGSTSTILIFYGLTIFLILSIIRLPIMIIFAGILLVIYLILKSIHVIQIEEQTVEAHLPFLGKAQE